MNATLCEGNNSPHPEIGVLLSHSKLSLMAAEYMCCAGFSVKPFSNGEELASFLSNNALDGLIIEIDLRDQFNAFEICGLARDLCEGLPVLLIKFADVKRYNNKVTNQPASHPWKVIASDMKMMMDGNLSSLRLTRA